MPENDSPAPVQIEARLDTPAPGESVYDRAIYLSGWIHAPAFSADSCEVRAYLDDSCIAQTRNLFHLPASSSKPAIRSGAPTGFRMLGKTKSPAEEKRQATLRITAAWGGKPGQTMIEQTIAIEPTRLHQRHYGEVVYPENEKLLHRDNIYGSGPPIREAGVDVTNLLLGYLPEGASVVDIGCGAGAFGPPLMASGHRWLGLETSSHCCDILRERELPYRQVDSATAALPSGTKEWECGICIEVLEHIQEPAAFLSEIARITSQRVLFSVPNIEVLPYMYGWNVVPWHMLEADHKNFFTRTSLHTILGKHFRSVEVYSYGQHPLIMREGIPVYMHLLAVADH